MACGFLVTNLAAGATITVGLGEAVAAMPLTHLFSEQPRERARLLLTSSANAVLLVDFGDAVTIDCIALIGTTLNAQASYVVRASLTDPAVSISNSILTTGTVAAETSDAAGGNVVCLLASPVSARYWRIAVTNPNAPVADIGLLVMGRLIRLERQRAYGGGEGRLVLDQRDRNERTGAEFVVPALVNPRTADVTLPMLTLAEASGVMRDIVAGGAARDLLWVPETSAAQAELNLGCIWGAAQQPGARALVQRRLPTRSTRELVLTERV